MDDVQDVFIAERNVRVSPQAANDTHTGRTARRTREIDPKNNKWFAIRHHCAATKAAWPVLLLTQSKTVPIPFRNCATAARYSSRFSSKMLLWSPSGRSRNVARLA
jgi:hypothetical protein